LLLNKYRALTTLDAQVHVGEVSVRPILIATTLFLASACSGTGGSTSATTPRATTDASPKVSASIDPATVTPEYVASLPRDQAEAAMSSLTQRHLRLAMNPCPGLTDACLSEQLEASLDQSGELAALCKVNGTGKEYHVCLLIAPVTVAMVTAAGGNPATDIDWSDVDSTNNAARRQFAEFIFAKKCGDDVRCFVDQAAALLGLSPAVAKSCQRHESPSDRMNCLSDAQEAEVLQRAIRSLS
jgi:hypothetical protein